MMIDRVATNRIPARNLKFYALSLKKAMAPAHPLEFFSSTFTVRVYELNEATGIVQLTDKLFVECSVWQLLNLTADQVLDLPGRLSTEYGISAAFVEKVMEKYIVQTIGKDALEAEFKVAPCRYLISATNHYSWPKAAGGLRNLLEGHVVSSLGIQPSLVSAPLISSRLLSTIARQSSVDSSIPLLKFYTRRLDTKDLDRQLRFCLENHIAVYAVVVCCPNYRNL